MPITGPGPSPDGKCCNVTVMTRCKGCPYYQSAEYKAHKASDELYRVMQECSGEASKNGAGQLPMTDAEMIATLEAAGYTVTPPDPLAADREFLILLIDALSDVISTWRAGDGIRDNDLIDAMEYLRANKGRVGL